MNDQQQSRADALTEAQRKALETAVNVLNINWEHETANELWEAFTAPVSQPAAAPIDPRANRGNSVGDWLWCELMDYCKERGMPPANNDRLFDLVKRARAAWDSKPAPSPADERAAFPAWCDRFPEISAVERLRDAWQAARAAAPEDQTARWLLHRAHEALARAALTQIPGGERLWDEIGEYLTTRAAAAPVQRNDHICLDGEDCCPACDDDALIAIIEWHFDHDHPDGRRLVAMARDVARAAASPAADGVRWNLVNPQGEVVAVETTCVKAWARISGYKPTVEGLLGYEEQGWRVLPVAPQPAQADAQRKALQRAIDHAVMSDREDEEEALRALLAAHPGQPEPRAEVTGDTVLVPKRVVELLRIINRDGVIKRASELQEVYRLVDAARAQGGES
ncbi:hypothetical protein KGP93_07705 [Burkholderia multivorans]|nr:hypothetical protein [Burkholderia multivorans]